MTHNEELNIQRRGYAAAINSGAPVSVLRRYEDRINALTTTPTDRQRMEEYRAEMNQLRSTLKAVAAQRDTLATELLHSAWDRDSARWAVARDFRGVVTILTDLVESGNVIDINGFLS